MLSSLAKSEPLSELLKGKLVYALDDEETSLKLVEMLLAAHGADVRAFSRADGLFEATLKQSPDLFVLDVMMPGMDGWMVMEKLRRMPNERITPIVFTTCLFAPGEEAPLNDKEKYCKIISKPLTVDRFQSTLEEIFNA